MTRFNRLLILSLPLLLVACTVLERKELVDDFNTIAVPALTNPANYTSPTTIIGAAIGVGATIAANYIKRKFFNGQK